MAPKYTPQQQTEAIDLYLKHGTTEASKQTGIPTRTISRWVKQADKTVAQAKQKTEQARVELARRTAERREHIKVRLLDKIEDLLTRMDNPHYDFKGKDARMVEYPTATSGDVKNYAVSVGVLIDKFRLENGEATVKTEVSLEQALSKVDAEIEKLSRELAEHDS